MRIFIVGGTGLLGRELIEILLRRGHEIISLGRSELEYPADDRIKHYVCNRNDTCLTELLSSIDFECVIDLAGFHYIHLQDSIEALQNRCVKYVFMSSVAVASVDEFGAKVLPIQEVVYPLNGVQRGYAFEKAMCEHLIISANQKHASTFQGVIVRSGEFVGGGDMRERYFYKRLLSECKSLLIPDGGGNLVHLTDIRDVAAALAHVALTPEISCGIFHVAGPNTMLVQDLVLKFISLNNVEMRIVSVPNGFIQRYKKGYYFPFYPRNTAIECLKLKQTGFSIKYSVTQSIERSYERYRNIPLEKRQLMHESDKALKQTLLTIKEEHEIINSWLSI